MGRQGLRVAPLLASRPPARSPLGGRLAEQLPGRCAQAGLGPGSGGQQCKRCRRPVAGRAKRALKVPAHSRVLHSYLNTQSEETSLSRKGPTSSSVQACTGGTSTEALPGRTLCLSSWSEGGAGGRRQAAGRPSPAAGGPAVAALVQAAACWDYAKGHGLQALRRRTGDTKAPTCAGAVLDSSS